MNARKRFEPILFDGVFRTHQHERCRVSDLARSRRRDATAVKQRFEARHAFERRVAARSFVLAECSDGLDLRGEMPSVDGRHGAPMAFEGYALHLLARDIPLLGDHFCCSKLSELPLPKRRLPSLTGG